ncbi:MAG: ArsR family transcriptional regulator [Nitrososphaerota archaeon]|nr:ArsR family transcriptional regulator [Nitrososphaerota archaeon]
MEQKELDSILQVIENPVRRRIIKRLSREPGYALQLSKELGLGQPLVAKHLAIMEGAGLVTSSMESSSTGPHRKRYSLARSISITMDLAPNTFIERGIALDQGPEGRSPSQLRDRMRTAIDQRDDGDKLARLSEILQEVDSKMREVEKERFELLAIRDQAMQEAAAIVVKLELDKRRVLFHILDEHDKTAEGISESLNLREAAVRTILEELEKEFFS